MVKLSKLFFGILSMLFLLNLSACEDLSDDVDDLKKTVAGLQEAINELKSANNNGKVIKSVEPLTGAETGWTITFTDNTKISVKNGKDAVTPYLQIDENGYWSVSYDNRATFKPIYDKDGNPVLATGQGTGAEGVSIRVVIDKDGYYAYELYYASKPNVVLETIKTPTSSDPSTAISSIKKNEQDNTVTLIMGDGTTFVFNLDPSQVSGIVFLVNKLKMVSLSTSTIEFRVNPSNSVFNYDVASSGCQIQLDMVGTVTRASAASYVTTPTNYKLTKIEPAVNDKGETKVGQYKAYINDEGRSDSYNELMALVISTKNEKGELAQVSSSPIEIYKDPSDGSHVVMFTTFDFKNANNKTNGFEVILNVPNAVSIESNTVNVDIPYYTDITALAADFTVESGYQVFVGATKQVSGVTKNDFTNPVMYRIVSPDNTEKSVRVAVQRVGLPVVYIDTPGHSEITSKDIWTENSDMKIVLGDGTIDYEGKTSIRGRGNSTWGMPKKPYAIKLDKKAPILGMPSHKRWVLLANWMDRTLMRNHVAFKISKETGLDWTVRGDFVEVVLNGKHQGCYYLCEQIKVDKNRVNVTELKNTVVDPQEITGGYLLEFDTNYDEINKFRSAYYNLPVMLKDPDEENINNTQLAYITDFINNTIEGEFQKADYVATRNYEKNLDVNSFVDWWIVHELTANGEARHPKSVYMSKDRGGKLKAGPVWDFDWQTFTDHPNDGKFVAKDAVWFDKLFNDPVFVSKVKERWSTFKPQFTRISSFIRDEADRIEYSADINIQLWPLKDQPNINYDEQKTFKEAITRMVSEYEKRLTWLDTSIKNL
ncbi:CotH kinase family protein [Bacteroides sp. 51]|uniref:CotH kinase family protein n=1 Tax=Bacteroides sp. 51 TaxID=2302938 RepID=UPI0013D4BCBF|nr:CotH kinase family protein [Bacteroides sp. 51]NDV83879.1 hypothetical protein [Bacteroides sp. 51]